MNFTTYKRQQNTVQALFYTLMMNVKIIPITLKLRPRSHTTPQEFENGGFTPKTREKFRNVTGNFGFVE